MTATTAQAIFDRDHGTDNEGWYIRFRLDDGQERDCPLNTDDPDTDDDYLLDAAQQEAQYEDIDMAGAIFEVRR